MSDKSPNNSKSSIQRAARALKNKPGWDPHRGLGRREEMQDQLERAVTEERNQRIYSQTDECADCLQERANLADDTALCEKHLHEAMGIG